MSDFTDVSSITSAPKQRLRLLKTNSVTSVAGLWSSLFDRAGNPGAGTLAGVSTTTGTVPTDATTGVPIINAFGASATGRLLGMEYGASVAGRLMVYDMLLKLGAYNFNANTTGQSSTSFSSRVPAGTDFSGCELWLEQVTAGTLVQNVNVTYTNQAGTTGRSTGTVAAPAALIVNRMVPLPLQAGDAGVQAVSGVVGSVASAGTFNILVLRKLWEGRVPLANGGDSHDFLMTQMPQLWADSALCAAFAPDSTSTGIVDITAKIGNA